MEEEAAKEGVAKKGKIRETIESVLIALVFALVIRTVGIQAFKIPSGSMEPTLLIGDYLLVTKYVYGYTVENIIGDIPLAGAVINKMLKSRSSTFMRTRFLAFGKPQRNDIIVFQYPVDPDKDFIKRVIAVEDDMVYVKDKKLFINGAQVVTPQAVNKEPMTLPREISPRDNFGPIMVPKGHIFVMGDNRDSSLDSRFWGVVPIADLKGKAFIIYWSFDNNYALYRPDGIRLTRLGTLIQNIGRDHGR